MCSIKKQIYLYGAGKVAREVIRRFERCVRCGVCDSRVQVISKCYDRNIGTYGKRVLDAGTLQLNLILFHALEQCTAFF